MDENLKYAIENGIIDMSHLQMQIEMQKRQNLLNQHPFSIWEGTDKNWHTYLPDEEKGRVPKKRKNKKEIEDVVISYWKEQAENPTIEAVFKEWVDRRLELKKISPATHTRYTQIYNRHYYEFGQKKIKDVTEEDFTEFLEGEIPKQGLTAKAFSNLKTVTRGFLKRAKKRKLIDFNVDELISDLDTSDRDFKKVIKENEEEVFDEIEMPRVIEYLRQNMDLKNLGILLMFVTGIRVGELVTLKHEDFDNNTFKIRRTETKFINEYKETIYEVKEFPKSEAGLRTAIIPKDYAWIAQKLKWQNPFGDYIFVENGKRLRTNAIRARMRKICNDLNIVKKSPHKIRKTYGSILLDNNIDQRMILDMMGHAEISCTEGHYHRNRKQMTHRTRIVSDIPEFKVN